MDRNQMTPKQVCKKIEELVKEIQSYDGSSGHVEKAWREDQQYLLSLLSKHPMDVYELSDDLKEQVEKILKGYLYWSFNGYW